MNERIRTLLIQAQDLARTEVENDPDIKPPYHIPATEVHKGLGLSYEKFAELIMQDMHKKVIASILITDVVMEEKGQVPTSEDYIRAINKDFGVEE